MPVSLLSSDIDVLLSFAIEMSVVGEGRQYNGYMFSLSDGVEIGMAGRLNFALICPEE